MSSTEKGREPYRPLIHYTPHAGWINDPNGLVLYDGVYHMFYQHHPYSENLGPMHWGHATSQDLITWEEQLVALYPDANGVIFSGSATVDWKNSAGFGDEALVTVFTSHDDEHVPVERQSLAYSTDAGHTFTKFAGNPVLFPPPNTPDFRDPRVLWYGSQGGHWVMVLAAGDEVQFFRSDDLKNWTQTGAFGKGQGAHGGVWECPDLFALSVVGEDAARWVLVVGINPGGQAKGSGTQYFVGDFDGATFVNENAADAVLWLDWGADAYATQSWDGVLSGRRIITSWMSNWHYARETPTTPWRGSMTLPRELSLLRTPSGLRVAQSPVQELAEYYGQEWEADAVAVGANSEKRFDSPPLHCFDLDVEMTLDASVRRAGIRLRDGLHGVVSVMWDGAHGKVALDRSASGVVDFQPDFAAVHGAPFTLRDGKLTLRVIVDAASVEVFAGDGEVAITDSIYPVTGEWHVSLFAEGGAATASVAEREIVMQ